MCWLFRVYLICPKFLVFWQSLFPLKIYSKLYDCVLSSPPWKWLGGACLKAIFSWINYWIDGLINQVEPCCWMTYTTHRDTQVSPFYLKGSVDKFSHRDTQVSPFYLKESVDKFSHRDTQVSPFFSKGIRRQIFPNQNYENSW